ncbi:MAG TPA: aminopeptidase N [Actinocrinis sp.]|nr:aminopeptidase N [Actinocrinis sp.]
MPVAEISRTQTRARARLVTVQSYDVDLDLSRGEAGFGSATTIRFTSAEAGADTYLDLEAEPGQVEQVLLNGVALDPAVQYADGRIALPGLPAGPNTVRVVASLSFRVDGAGFHRSVDPLDGKVYAYTKFEPDNARRVFACFEQPDLKAPFSISVTAPAHWTVLSTQPTPEPAALDGGLARWEFEPTPPLPTYLAHVTAGEYVLVRSSHTTARGQVIPMAVAGRASLGEFLDADGMFEVTAAGLDYFTGLFDLDYPFAKYDQVFVPGFPSGAMEHPGAVSISEDMVFRSRVTENMYELRAVVVLHEMAHMWFGNYVTMQWWDDLWLNESFAEFAGTEATARVTRYTGAWTTFANARKGWGYSQDQLPSTHPVAADVETVTEAMANFDGISYAKGASVLKQLIAYLGQEVFFAGIRAYFAEHAWGNATLAQFLQTLEAASGRDLGGWARVWLQTAGPNTLRARFETDDAGRFSSFAVAQEAPAQFPTLRPHHIAIGLYARQGGQLVRVHRTEVDVDGDLTEIPQLVGVAQPDLVLLNDDDLGYTLVRFDERSQATLADAVGQFQDSLARSVCMTAATTMAEQGEMSVPTFVRLVGAAMETEASVPVVQSLHQSVLVNVLLFLADPAWAHEGQSLLAQAAVRLLHAAEPGGDQQLVWAQLLARSAVDDAQLDLVGALLDGSTVLQGLVVDAELRWALLRRLAAGGRAGDEQIDAELVRDGSEAGIRHAHACRAAVPDAAHKEAAWELLTGQVSPDVQTLVEVALTFRRPDRPELIVPYTDRFFQVLAELWDRRAGFAQMLTVMLMFPTVDAGPGLLAKADAFLDAHKDADPALIRAVVEGRDSVVRAIRSRELAA